ncbi:MAG TPA: PadR family transcriptional regulator [Vicinamibacterales bacterium]|nr:PadR family transcriptional regulator [Vicinamibacterales bacterium]
MKHIQDYYAPVLGEFEHLVLTALLRVGSGAYGAAIRQEIEDRTGRRLSVSAVYVTLTRLERKKMVVSYVGPPTAQRGGRRKKHYVIAEEGEHALGRAYRAFRAITEGLEDRLAEL